MNVKTSKVVFSFLKLMMIGSVAHAFGNACKRVNFSVDNNYGKEITVTRFELFSESEGRFLNEDFRNVVVPVGAKDFAVRRGETIEHAENDKITEIIVHFDEFVDTDPDGPGHWVSRTRHDKSVTDPICRADRWYKATIER
jgi:hypothetical protein